MPCIDAKSASEKWIRNSLQTAHVPCHSCGRKTRAYFSCQWCKVKWTKEERQQGYAIQDAIVDQYKTEKMR